MSPHKQRQETKLSVLPKQLQLSSLLQTPLALLAQRIKEEVEKNVLLEPLPDKTPSNAEENLTQEDISPRTDYEEDPMERYQGSNKNLHSLYDQRLLHLPQPASAREELHSQLIGHSLGEEEKIIANFLIESLDAHGLLTKPLLTLRHDIEKQHDIILTHEQFKASLRLIQSLDPAGIGGKDVSESLYLQLCRIRPLPRLAMRIVQEAYDDFLHKRNAVLKKKLACTEEALQKALSLIESLQPYPFFIEEEAWIKKDARRRYPDFILHNEQGKLVVQAQKIRGTGLQISPYYTRLMERYGEKKDTTDRAAYQYLKEKHEQALDFLHNLQRRSELLFKATQGIVERQKAYFLSGDETLMQPLRLKDMALPLGVDISTMSRMVFEKYIETDFGIIPLKHCFLRARTNKEGTALQPTLVANYIRTILEKECPETPYGDEEIREQLATEYGLHLARRTIAKYRKKMGIEGREQRREPRG